MSYSAAQMNTAVAALVRQIHGIRPDVARAWASAEQGVNYNILGVTYVSGGRQHLYTYSSWDEGAAAAYHLIQGGPYAGIRSALKVGTSTQQAAAIIASPWNHPYYSTGRGAGALRKIASAQPPTTDGVKYHLVVRGLTPVYNSPGGTRFGKITSGTYTALRVLRLRKWWYKILGPDTSNIVGKWMPAEPTMAGTEI